MSNVAGGWSIHPTVNHAIDKMQNDQLAIFEKAFGDFLGAQFIPLVYVGSQVVAGIKHMYIAQRKMIHPAHSETTVCKVVIFCPLEGAPGIMEISDI